MLCDTVNSVPFFNLHKFWFVLFLWFAYWTILYKNGAVRGWEDGQWFKNLLWKHEDWCLNPQDSWRCCQASAQREERGIFGERWLTTCVSELWVQLRDHALMNKVESNSGELMHQCTHRHANMSVNMWTCHHKHAHVYHMWVELYNMCFFFSGLASRFYCFQGSSLI